MTSTWWFALLVVPGGYLVGFALTCVVAAWWDPEMVEGDLSVLLTLGLLWPLLWVVALCYGPVRWCGRQLGRGALGVLRWVAHASPRRT